MGEDENYYYEFWNVVIYIDKPGPLSSLPAARMKEETSIRAANIHWYHKSQFFLREYFQPVNRKSAVNASLMLAQYYTDSFSRVL